MTLCQPTAGKSEAVKADLVHCPVRAHPEDPRWTHSPSCLRIHGFTRGLFLPGRVGHTEAVQVNRSRVDVVRVGVALYDEAEQRAQGFLAQRKTGVPQMLGVLGTVIV
jgi:hypothetical protein